MPTVSDAKQDEVWQHLMQLPASHRPNGVTQARLERIKAQVYQYPFFWQDVVVRHGLLDRTPEQLKAADLAAYEHMLGNAWGMIATLVQQMLLAPEQPEVIKEQHEQRDSAQCAALE